MGLTQQELIAALGYDFYHVMGRAQGTMQFKLKPAGFTVPILQAFCGVSCVSLLDDSFGFTLKEVRASGATVKMLLQEELRLYPDVVNGTTYFDGTNNGYRANHRGHKKLKVLSDFASAGYDEAEVRTVSRETNVPVFHLVGNNEQRL